MPSAAYIEMLLCAADAVYGTTAVAIEDIQIPEALFLTEQPTELRTVLIPREDGGFTVEIGVTAPDASTTRLHARAVLRAPAYSRASRPPLPLPLPETETETGTGTGTDGELVLDAEAVYAAYLRSGLDYGPRFRTALSVRLVSEGLAVTEISAQAQNPAEHLPPPLNDAGTHALSVLLNDDNTWASDHIGQVRVFKKPRASRLTAVARLSQGGDDRVRVLDVTLYEGGQPVMEMAGMELKRLGRKFRPPAAAAPRDGVRDGARSGAAQEPAVPMPAGRGPERVAWASRQIRAHVAGLLRIDVVDDVDPHTTFLELGLDSLVALELRSALEDRLGLSLDTNVVFAHPTPERLAEHLDDLLGRLSG
jgi:acyl carrier protein